MKLIKISLILTVFLFNLPEINAFFWGHTEDSSKSILNIFSEDVSCDKKIEYFESIKPLSVDMKTKNLIYKKMADCYISRNLNYRAIEILETGIKLYDDDFYFKKLIEIYSKMNMCEKVFKLAEKTEFENYEDSLKLKIADAYYNLGFYEKARDIYERILKKTELNNHFLNYINILFHSDLDKLKKVIFNLPDSSDKFKLISRYYAYNGDYERALSYIDRALSLKNDEELEIRKTLYLIFLKKYEESYKNIENISDEKVGNFLKGFWHFSKGDYEKAEFYFENVKLEKTGFIREFINRFFRKYSQRKP